MSLHQASAVAISLLIFSIFFNLGYADKLAIRNQMKRKGVLQVACQAMISKWPWHKISDGDIYTVSLPLGASIDLAPAHCTGKWNDANGGEGNGIIFSAYDYFRDHQSCRESCEMVAKDGGWYIRSSTSREWELVLRFQSRRRARFNF